MRRSSATATTLLHADSATIPPTLTMRVTARSVSAPSTMAVQVAAASTIVPAVVSWICAVRRKRSTMPVRRLPIQVVASATKAKLRPRRPIRSPASDRRRRAVSDTLSPEMASAPSDGSGAGATGGPASGGGSGDSGAGTVVTFPSITATGNQRASAAAVEALRRSRLFDAVLSQSVAGARQAFDAVSAEMHAGVLTAMAEETRMVRDLIVGRLQEASQGPAAGPVLWGMGFGVFGCNDGGGNAAALKRSLGGFVLGADQRLDAPGLERWRLGVAGGYFDNTLSLGLRSSRGDVKAVFRGLYAGALYEALDIKLGVLGGATQVTTQRTVPFLGFMDSNHSRGNGTLAQGFGELGYRIDLPAGYVEPVIRAAVIRVGLDGVREGGASAALRVSARSVGLGTTTLGLRDGAALPEQVPLVARGFMGWRHAFGDVVPRALVAFQGGGMPFSVAGTPIDRNAAVAEVGVQYRASTAVTLGVSYSAQVGSRALRPEREGLASSIDSDRCLTRGR